MDKMKIYKYSLKPSMHGERQTIMMPKVSRIIEVHRQSEDICLWAEVFADDEQEEKTFRVYGTGVDITTPGVYVGTAHQIGGWMVFHVYQEN